MNLFLKRVSIIFLISVSLVLFAENIRAEDERGSPEGLRLDKRVSKTLKKKLFRPNPHGQYDCKECHKKEKLTLKLKGKKKKSTKKKKKKKTKKKSYKRMPAIRDEIKLCDGCHEGENLHPVNVDPKKSALKIKPPRFLPLGDGKYAKKIVCSTCHDVHAKDASDKLLRGFKGAKGFISAQLKDRQDFCRACHGKKLIERSPHKPDEQACKFCHITDPRKEEKPQDTVRFDIVKRCNFCHAKLDEEHFLAVNAFADKNLKDEIKDLDLPFIGGEITCVTCHDQHWKSNLPHRLRPNYVAFAEKSIRINPHWTGTFCLSCHDKPPKEGEISFLFDGDFVKVCNRCHDTEEAKADIHPVDIKVPPNMKGDIPKDFALAGGDTITCVTCHELKYQTSVNNPLRRKNPKFLRGAPYSERSGICFRCHIKESYERMSPHDQLDENGEIIEAKCLFCHASRPDVDIVGIDNVEFSGNVTEYCYGCHAGKEERHPVNVTHTGREPSEERLKCIEKTEKLLFMRFPLYEGEVFCGTCHNPHQQGVQKGAIAKGASQETRLRLPSGYEICVACHCDKGGL
ncbi:cytochrome c3 family protein [Thermodesulfobacteriota bacterium]